MELWTPISSAMLLLLIVCIVKLRDFYQKKELHQNVAECSYKYSQLEIPPSRYLSRAQRKLPQQYQIIGDDWNIVHDILSEYEDELFKLYFSNKLPCPKCRYQITGEIFFMLSLGDFLSRHEKAYPCHQLVFDENDNLTNFGVVYYKLLFITCSFLLTKPHPEKPIKYSNFSYFCECWRDSTKNKLDKQLSPTESCEG